MQIDILLLHGKNTQL